jgi:uncharacterized protein YecE (DUF72 family)
MNPNIRIGTASWADPDFVRDWYPAKLPARERLRFYAERFDLVELNSSFYGIPDRRQVDEWNRVTPDGFLFDIKLHKALSRHSAERNSLPRELQKLVGTEKKVMLNDELERAIVQHLLTVLDPLEKSGKLGAFLLQLTPGFSPRGNSLDELAGLLDQFRAHRVAVEFRNRSWVNEERLPDTLAFLRDHNAAFVCVDAPAVDHFTVMPAVDAVTAPITYLRLHGRDAKAYLTGKTVAQRFNYEYSEEELKGVAERVTKLSEKAEQVHVVFNNNSSNYAPVAARHLRQLFGQDPGPPVEISPKLL